MSTLNNVFLNIFQLIYLDSPTAPTKAWYVECCARSTKHSVHSGASLATNGHSPLQAFRYDEKNILVVFFVLILLWLFRAPRVIPGWGDLFKEG